MTNAPFALDRREFIALAGGLAAVLVVGDGAYFSSRRSAAHAQPVPSESGTLTQPETPLNGTIASPNTETAAPSADASGRHDLSRDRVSSRDQYRNASDDA